MNAPERNLLVPATTVEFELDGRAVQAFEGETILQVADRHGIAIPRLCYTPGYRADGNCRSCVVEIDGERTLAPSCCRAPGAGMKVKATSERAVKSQKMVLEMLLSDMPAQGHKWIGDDATRWRIVWWILALVPVTLAPVALGQLGAAYAVIAGGLGLWFLVEALRLVRRADRASARRTFVVSLAYLLGTFAAMLGDLAWRSVA